MKIIFLTAALAAALAAVLAPALATAQTEDELYKAMLACEGHEVMEPSPSGLTPMRPITWSAGYEHCSTLSRALSTARGKASVDGRSSTPKPTLDQSKATAEKLKGK